MLLEDGEEEDCDLNDDDWGGDADRVEVRSPDESEDEWESALLPDSMHIFKKNN